MTTVAQVSEHLRTLFTSVADDLARRSGFVQRRAKLSGAVFAQAVVFGWLANPQAALPELTQAAAAVGVRISPPGLDQRCTESAAVFLEQLVGAALGTLIDTAAVLIPLLERFAAVLLLDRTTLALPGALGGPAGGRRCASGRPAER